MTTTQNFAALSKLKNPFNDQFSRGEFIKVGSTYYYVAYELIAGTLTNYVYKSTDKCETWTKFTPATYSNNYCFNVFTDGTTLYAQFKLDVVSSYNVVIASYNTSLNNWSLVGFGSTPCRLHVSSIML